MLHEHNHLTFQCCPPWFVYIMLSVPACITQISGASSDVKMFTEFQCSVQNLVQSSPIKFTVYYKTDSSSP